MDDTKTNLPVVEASDINSTPSEDIVTSSESPTDSAVVNSQVDEQMVIESSIKNHMKLLEELGNNLKTQKEMMKSYLDNDETYMKSSETAKKAAGLKNQAKRLLLNAPAGAELNEKIRGLNEQKKELQDALSYYLREYQRITGLNHFEGEDGEVREIVYMAKLVKRNVFEK
jgi:hypothetical protein